MAAETNLTEIERATLDLESRHWRYAGSKEVAIRAELGISPTSHRQRLNRLLDDERALVYAPVLVNRLRRVRQGRSRSATRRTSPQG